MAGREATDEWLMERAASGWEPGIEELMKRYNRPLLAFIHRQTDLEAEDIFQETWLRVVRNAKRFDSNRKFSTWLFQIAINLCRDAHRRRRARLETVPLDDAGDIMPSDDSDELDMVRLGMNSLSQHDTEILSLRYFLGYKESEVAEILDLPIGTVKSRTHHAVARLKKIINPQE